MWLISMISNGVIVGMCYTSIYMEKLIKKSSSLLRLNNAIKYKWCVLSNLDLGCHLVMFGKTQ